ncbi:MAG: histidine phosphatase family protein [Acidobacteriota bacterium]
MTHTPTALQRVFLIRHGETAWSLTGQHTSHTDLALTATGEAAARELGERLRGIAFTHVVSSPLERARQTCALAGLAARMRIDPDLREWEYGDYEGARLVDIRRDRPGWNVFRDGCPNGEMPSDLSARVDRVIAHVRSLHGDIALFSHGHLARALSARWVGLPIAEGRTFLLGTASVSVLGYEHDQPDEPAIVHWNVTSGRGF